MENLTLISLSSPSGKMHSSCTKRDATSESRKVWANQLNRDGLPMTPKHTQHTGYQVFHSKLHLSPFCPSVPVLCTCSPDISYYQGIHLAKGSVLQRRNFLRKTSFTKLCYYLAGLIEWNSNECLLGEYHGIMQHCVALGSQGNSLH